MPSSIRGGGLWVGWAAIWTGRVDSSVGRLVRLHGGREEGKPAAASMIYSVGRCHAAAAEVTHVRPFDPVH